MEFDNIETVQRAVEIDAGISIVPQSTIGQEVAKQTLAAAPLDHPDMYRPLAAIVKRGKVLSPAMRQFINILKEGN
jgi:DNA-binding transcriptional LysR family regulator